MIFNEYIPNKDSVRLLFDVLSKLKNRGLHTTEFSIQTFTLVSRKIKFMTISDLSHFMQLFSIYERTNPKEIGNNIYMLKRLSLDNVNLFHYINSFEVNMEDYNNIQFKKSNIRNNFIQNKIDREVDRYMRIIQQLLQEYKNRIDSIIHEEQKRVEVSGDNYVDINYVINNPKYVTPQQ